MKTEAIETVLRVYAQLPSTERVNLEVWSSVHSKARAELTALQRIADLMPGLVEALENLIDYARDAANGRYEYDDPRFPRAVKAFAEAHALVASPRDTSMVVASKTPETSDKPDTPAEETR